MKNKILKKMNLSKKGTNGITLIALVITIIVLLILAGVSIAMLTGENGIISKAIEARDKNIIGREKEEIALAYAGARIEKQGERITADLMNEQFNKNSTKATAKQNIIVSFEETGNMYKINKDGEIIEIDENTELEDEYPGELEGVGTEEDPLIISSVEDLVAFFYNSNTIEGIYKNKIIHLGKNLNINSDKSYVNPETLYITDSGNGYKRRTR